jgi:sterol desaturase/sphingolipid hydroxylase (fatty acid hydroxylase superfamily)
VPRLCRLTFSNDRAHPELLHSTHDVHVLAQVTCAKSKKSQPLLFFCIRVLVCLRTSKKNMPIRIHTLFHGVILGTLNLCLTACMESFFTQDIQRLQRKKGGSQLYKEAWVANVINLQFLVPLTHYCRVVYTCHTGLTVWEQCQAVVGILVIESFLYYLVHKAFHECKSLYWMHSFHHKFNEVILPSTACAVSVFEFSFAYMLPIVLGSYIMKADRISGIIASGIIGGSNLLIHCPLLAHIELPNFLASAKGHFQHHRKLTQNYGAPVLQFDTILAWGSGEKITKQL